MVIFLDSVTTSNYSRWLTHSRLSLSIDPKPHEYRPCLLDSPPYSQDPLLAFPWDTHDTLDESLDDRLGRRVLMGHDALAVQLGFR